MTPGQAGEVAAIHASVLTDSVYTWIGRRFVDYYYRNLLCNRDFACHVHAFDGRITGFLASTSAAGRVFYRQLLRDALRVGLVLGSTVVRHPSRLAVVLSATRFLFVQRPAMLPQVDGEVLSFAVLPEYRASQIGSDGVAGPTEFYARWKIAVARDLFFAAVRDLAARGVREVKIMTPADNPASNRFYTKVGCRVAATGLSVFGHPTNLYYGLTSDILALASVVTSTGRAGG